jgi:hypothetical protein
MAGFTPMSLTTERRRRTHAAARRKLRTLEERLAYDVGRALAGSTDSVLRIMEYARKSRRPFCEDDPIEAEYLLESIYLELESGERSLGQANGLLDSLKSQYEARPIENKPAAPVKRKSGKESGAS